MSGTQSADDGIKLTDLPDQPETRNMECDVQQKLFGLKRSREDGDEGGVARTPKAPKLTDQGHVDSNLSQSVSGAGAGVHSLFGVGTGVTRR